MKAAGTVLAPRPAKIVVPRVATVTAATAGKDDTTPAMRWWKMICAWLATGEASPRSMRFSTYRDQIQGRQIIVAHMGDKTFPVWNAPKSITHAESLEIVKALEAVWSMGYDTGWEEGWSWGWEDALTQVAADEDTLGDALSRGDKTT